MKNKVQAKRVGQNLVVVFAHAAEPVTWSFDLEKNHSFALVIQNTGGEWSLGVKSPTGNVVSVARFETENQAQQAQATIARALLQHELPFWQKLMNAAAVTGVVVMVMIFGLFAFSNLATHQAMQMQMAMQYQQMEMQRAAQGLPPLGQAQNPENQQAAGMGDAVGPQRPESAQAQPPAAESGTGKPNDQAMPPGVPLPADEVLE